MHGAGRVKNTVALSINEFVQAVVYFLNAVEKHILQLFCRPTGCVFSVLPTAEQIMKDVRSGLRQYLATESSVKMMKNTLYFTLKALFVLKKFKILS